MRTCIERHRGPNNRGGTESDQLPGMGDVDEVSEEAGKPPPRHEDGTRGGVACVDVRKGEFEGRVQDL